MSVLYPNCLGFNEPWLLFWRIFRHVFIYIYILLLKLFSLNIFFKECRLERHILLQFFMRFYLFRIISFRIICRHQTWFVIYRFNRNLLSRFQSMFKKVLGMKWGARDKSTKLMLYGTHYLYIYIMRFLKDWIVRLIRRHFKKQPQTLRPPPCNWSFQTELKSVLNKVPGSSRMEF